MIVLVLMSFGGHDHFRQALPNVDFLSLVVETDVPGIGPRAKRKHGKSVTKVVLADFQLQVLGSPSPDQLALCAEKRNAVVASSDGSVDLYD